MKVLVGTFNQKKALVGKFSVIVKKTFRWFVRSSNDWSASAAPKLLRSDLRGHGEPGVGAGEAEAALGPVGQLRGPHGGLHRLLVTPDQLRRPQLPLARRGSSLATVVLRWFISIFLSLPVLLLGSVCCG